MKVSEVRIGALDAAETLIESIYVKNPPHYAVYRTAERVMIHLADDDQEHKEQQAVLAALNPLRNEIHALIDGWRSSQEQDKAALTRLYDRRIADALTLALEKDPTSAQNLLKGTLDEIGEERQSRGRIEHLLYAVATAGAVAIVAILAFLLWGARKGPLLDDHINALFFAGAIGGVGALVSIGIAISERKLTTDLQTRDNVVDAILRVTTGAVGAVLLIAMLRADLIDVDIGNVDLAHRAETEQGAPPPGVTPATSQTSTSTTVASQAPATAPTGSAPPPAGGGGTGGNGNPGGTPAGPPPTPAATVTDNGIATAPVVSTPAPRPNPAEATGDGQRKRTGEFLVLLVIAFFAGFTERLVKQLAERMRFRDVAADLTPPVPLRRGTSDGGQTGGGDPGGGKGEGSVPAAARGGSDAEDEEDGCLAHHEVTQEEAIDDTQLPAAAGGVEEPSQSNP